VAPALNRTGRLVLGWYWSSKPGVTVASGSVTVGAALLWLSTRLLPLPSGRKTVQSIEVVKQGVQCVHGYRLLLRSCVWHMLNISFVPHAAAASKPPALVCHRCRTSAKGKQYSSAPYCRCESRVYCDACLIALGDRCAVCHHQRCCCLLDRTAPEEVDSCCPLAATPDHRCCLRRFTLKRSRGPAVRLSSDSSMPYNNLHNAMHWRHHILS
jgi:hypothetical protein